MADSSEAEKANPDPVPAQNQGDGDVTDSEDSLMIDSDGEQPSSRGPEARFQRPPGTSYDHSSLDQLDMRLHMENKNTQRKTDTDIRIVISYLRSVDESRNPEDIPGAELDRYLSTFFTIVKKHDGNEYEPASLRGMLCSVERYLKMKNYRTSVTRDPAFSCTRHALKYKQQKLREIGKGVKKPNEPIVKLGFDRVHQLFSEQEMGPNTPMSVINTLCFVIIVHFRLRKAIDHKNLLWGDIKLKTDSKGNEYIIYQPISVSNHNFKSIRTTDGKLCIWSKPELKDRDPVSIYKLYSQKRPPSMQHDNSPFYLGITTMNPTPMQSWYRTCAMGVNKLSDLVRMIRSITGLPRTTLDGSTENILSANFSIPSGNDRLPYSYKPITPVPNFTPIFKQKAESSEESTEGVGLMGNTEEADDESRSMCFSESPLSVSDSEHLSSSYRARNQTKGDQSSLTPLQQAKKAICDVIQTLEETDAKEIGKWLKQSSFWENDDFNDSQESRKEDTCEGETTTQITLSLTFNPRAKNGEEPIKISSVVTNQKPKNIETKDNKNDSLPSMRKRESTSLDDVTDRETSPSPQKRNKVTTPNPVNLTNENPTNVMTSGDDSPRSFKKSTDKDGLVAQISENMTSTGADILPSFSSSYNTVPHAHMAPAQRPSFFGSHDPNWSSSLTYPSLYHRGGMESVTPMTAHCSYTQYQFAQSLHSANPCQFPQNNM